MKGVGAKSRKPLSRQPSTVSRKGTSVASSRASLARSRSRASVSRSKRQNLYQSINFSGFKLNTRKPGKSIYKKRKGTRKLKTIQEDELVLRIKYMKSDLEIEEEALFMLFEVFHDILIDDRGDPTHNSAVKTVCLEPFTELCASIFGRVNPSDPRTFILYDENSDINISLNETYRLSLERLINQTYTDFEKILFNNIISNAIDNSPDSELDVRRIAQIQMAGLGYIFHDAGYEDLYRGFGAQTIAKFGNIDQWEQHPEGDEFPSDIHETLAVLQSSFTQSNKLNLKKYKKGNKIFVEFNYYADLEGIRIIKVYMKIVCATNEDHDTHQSYYFHLKVGGEEDYQPFPDENPRRHCFSVAEAKYYLTEHFSSNEEGIRNGLFIELPDKTFIFHPTVLKVFAMKAIGDKICFFDAKYHGTIDLGVQPAAVTHDRLAAAYLIRDLERKLKKNENDFKVKSNLIIPVKYYKMEIGERGGINFPTSEHLIIYNKGAQVFSELKNNHVQMQKRYNEISRHEEFLQYMKNTAQSNPGLSAEEIFQLAQQKINSNRRTISVGPMLSLGGVKGINKKTKKKPRKKKRLKKKQRSLRKKSK